MKHRLCRTAILTIALTLVLASCSSDPVAQRDEFYKSGQDYAAKGEYEAATIQYLNALKADGKYLPARLALADSYEKMGDYQAAIVELRRVLEDDPENVDAKLKLGRYYLAAGARDSKWFDEARKLAEEVLKIQPENVQARLLLGNSYAGLQDFDRSVESFQKALETDPDNLDAYLNLGASRFGQQDPAAAEQAFQDAVAKHPDSPKAYLGLGNFYLFSKRADEAEQSFRKAFELDATNQAALLSLVRLYLAERQPAKADAVFEEALKSAPDPLPLQLLQASYFLAQRRSDEATTLLRSLRESHPDNRAVAIQLAGLDLSQNKLEEASTILDELLKANDRDGEAHYLKGRILIQQKDFGPALAEVNRALELSPALIPAYLDKVDLLQQKADLAEAEKTARRVLELDRNNLLGRAKLAKLRALRRQSKSDIDDALSDADAVLAQMPGNVDALAARGEALLALRRLPEARQAFEKLHEGAPDNPFFVHRLGTIAALEGNPNQALEYFHQALRTNPDLADVLNDLVAVYLQQGERDRALSELDDLAAKSEKKAIFHILKGRIYMGAGETVSAERELRRAVEVDPNDYQAYILLGQLMMTEHKMPEAVREVDALIASKPQFAPGYLLRGFYKDASKEPTGAIEDYRKALDLFPEGDPGYGAAANNLAWILADRGENLTEALTLAQKARQIDPQNVHYADTLGWIYYKMGNYTLAVDQLEYSVNQGQTQPQHYYRLGMAYFKKGDAIHAKQTLRKALELSSTFEGADEARQTLAGLQ
ncbi:MAG: tetratricopeptide repeat protein [Acidobacteriota bacterium]